MIKTILEVAEVIREYFVDNNYMGITIAPNSQDSVVVYANKPGEVKAIEIWKDKEKERNVLMNLSNNEWIEIELNDSKEIIIESLLNIII